MSQSQELTTVSILALFETNKEQRATFVSSLLESIDNGEIDPLQVHLQIKCMEDIITQLTSTDEKKNKNVEAAKKYRSYLLSTAEKMGGKDFMLHNAKFKIGEVGTKYDYSGCGDPVFLELKAKADEAAKALKEREDFLKNAPLSGATIVVEDTGETVTIYPPAKTSTTSVSVSLQ